jgi:hypothetical protein
VILLNDAVKFFRGDVHMSRGAEDELGSHVELALTTNQN